MKKILIIALAIPFTLSLSACGKTDKEQRAACIALIQKSEKTPTELKKLNTDPVCQDELSKEQTEAMKHPLAVQNDTPQTKSPSYGADDL